MTWFEFIPGRFIHFSRFKRKHKPVEHNCYGELISDAVGEDNENVETGEILPGEVELLDDNLA